jgi:hypothetical protein
LALYHSLLKNCDNFILYVLAIDLETECYLSKLNENNLEIISLSLLESKYPELLSIKKERTRGEYCWTLTPYSIQYTINAFNINSCIYIDSDIYFFNNPRYITDNIGDNSVIITEHRYSPEYDQTSTSGKYCVQFMYFKNDSSGLAVLEWWRQRCFEWCYARNEDGKFGDQKYLDDWITRFKKIYIPRYIGCGLAPWNINRYNLCSIDNRLYIQDKITKEKGFVIFYHFHALKKHYESPDKTIWCLCSHYNVDESIKEFLYKEYINVLISIEENLDETLAIPVSKGKNISKPSFFSLIWLVAKDILKSLLFLKQYNEFKKEMSKQYNKFRSSLLETVRRKG